MARKAKGVVPSLQTVAPDEVIRKLRTYPNGEAVVPTEGEITLDELLEWFERYQQVFKQTAVFIYQNLEVIGQRDPESNRREALEIFEASSSLLKKSLISGLPTSL
jgi:hypothetical protein